VSRRNKGAMIIARKMKSVVAIGMPDELELKN
jgi:hypothetical protein